MSKLKLVIIAHDMRSTHNVGSLIRTAEALGVNKIYFTGYTPYPAHKKDSRLPYISEKLDKQINKTALGTQKLISWEHTEDIYKLIKQLRNKDYCIVGLEQNNKSIPIDNFKSSKNVALILGREVEGIDTKILNNCDKIIEIPLRGKKESLNVVQASAIAIYSLLNNLH